jgi:hypothetical protein
MPIKQSSVPKTKAKSTVITPSLVKITHHQSVRSSANYQSAEVSYGIELHVANNPKEIRAACAQAEDFVERNLISKVQEQQKLLAALGKNR